MGRQHRGLLAMVLAVLALALAGCKSDATVTVVSTEQGVGRIRVDVALDREAARGFGDPVKALATTDLADRGWAIEGVRVATDGSATFAVEKSFRNVAEANQILDELSGTDGPFHGLRLERRSTLLATEVTLRGTVDVRQGVEVLGDDDLRTLTGSASLLGFDPSALEKIEGKPLAEIVGLSVKAELPNATMVWKTPLGSSKAIALTGSTRQWSVPIGLAAVVLGLGALVIGLRAVRSEARPAGAPLADTPRS